VPPTLPGAGLYELPALRWQRLPISFLGAERDEDEELEPAIQEDAE